jgi:endonuclease YncB( thermonuclease family)
MRIRSGLFLALALGTLAAAPAPKKKSVLPFIADDYARALQEARARKVPIFIEAWAPW